MTDTVNEAEGWGWGERYKKKKEKVLEEMDAREVKVWGKFKPEMEMREKWAHTQTQE